MKKILSFAAAAAMLFTSCLMDETATTKGGEVQDEGLAKLTIKLTGNAAVTRADEGAAVEPTADVTATVFKSGWIFIIDKTSNKVTDAAEVDTTNASDINGTGFEFPRLVPENSKVFIVGNMPDEYSTVSAVRKLNTLDKIKGAFAAMYGTGTTAAHLDYTEAPIASTTKATNVIEPVELVRSNVTDVIVYTPGADNYTPAEIELSMNLEPVISRIEIGAFKGTGSMKDFTVTGIFLSNYYPYYTFGGSYYDPAGSDAYDMVDIVTGYDGTTGAVNGIAADPTVGSDWTGSDSGDAWEGNLANTYKAGPVSGSAWAVNVPAGTLPYIVVRMTDITYSDNGTDTTTSGGTDYYMLINRYSYTDNTNPASPVVRPVDALKANTIYSISEIGFKPFHLGLIANNANGTVIFDTGKYGEQGTNGTVAKPGKTITFVGNNEAGSVTVLPAGGDQSPVQPNTPVTITANNGTAAGTFKEWQISDADMEAAGISPFWLEDPTISFYMPNANITITAVWETP